MLDFLEAIGSAGVWPFWVPVLVWTALAGVVVLVLGALDRRLHPLAGYRLRQALLLALPVSLLAVPWAPVSWAAVADPLRPVSLGAFDPAMLQPLETVPAGVDPGSPASVAMAVLGVATVAMILLAVVRLAMLAADVRRLRRLRLAAPRVADPATMRTLGALEEQLGVRRPVELLEGPPDSVPMTFGGRRPVVVVPQNLLDSPESLRTVLAHELIHVRRADYLWALADCLTSAAFAFHPVVRLLQQGIERCRETSCDAEIVASGIVRPSDYAELLVRTHTPAQFPMTAVAASMSARSVPLKQRLETMKNFAETRPSRRQRLGVLFASGLLFVVVAAFGACVGGTERDATAPGDPTGLLVLDSNRPSSASDTQVFSYQVLLEDDGRFPKRTVLRVSEQGLLEELTRLEVQRDYLWERMDELSSAMEDVAGEDAGYVSDKIRWREYNDLQERQSLLRSKYKERIRMSETLRLQYETQKRMREQR
ncbi:MAG: M56 family metallopeptidase [Gemmatimonadota bacterium]|nr:M56 family metallopeptidase [Gemmatimonadota bacterium]